MHVAAGPAYGTHGFMFFGVVSDGYTLWVCLLFPQTRA